MTVLSQTQQELKRLLKERQEWRKERDKLKQEKIMWENNAKGMQKSAIKWRNMYNDLTEPLEQAARYCAILPPKKINERFNKHPHREFAISTFHPIYTEKIRPEDMLTFHKERLYWVKAMVYEDKFQELIHYRLQFDNGKVLAYQYSKPGLAIQSEKRIREEVTYQLAHAWYKEIHKGGE